MPGEITCVLYVYLDVEWFFVDAAVAETHNSSVDGLFGRGGRFEVLWRYLSRGFYLPVEAQGGGGNPHETYRFEAGTVFSRCDTCKRMFLVVVRTARFFCARRAVFASSSCCE